MLIDNLHLALADSNSRFRELLAIWVVALSSPVAQAAVLRVPGDYPTIQRAIIASASGDIIQVSPGVYSENISFRGKAITVTSTNPADAEVVKNTIIQGVG